MNLDKHTFGRSPAAMYLALLLSERNDRALLRRVTGALKETRELINDVQAAHYHTDEIKARSFNKLIELIQLKVQETVKGWSDQFIAHLVLNILTGELRVHRRRAAKAAHLRTTLARRTPSGETVPEVKVLPYRGEETEEERLTILRERSRRYLARRGKRNTLYAAEGTDAS